MGNRHRVHAILTTGMSNSQALLFRVLDCVENGERPEWSDLQEIAKMFRKILFDGEDPRKALGLSGKQSSGRNKKNVQEMVDTEWIPVLDVIELRQKGYSVERALSEVSERYIASGVKLEIITLKRHYNKHLRSYIYPRRANIRKNDILNIDVMMWRKKLLSLKQSWLKFPYSVLTAHPEKNSTKF